MSLWLKRRASVEKRRRRSISSNIDTSDGEAVLAMRNVKVYDNCELRFINGSLRPLYIEGSGDFFYRRNSLKRARKVIFLALLSTCIYKVILIVLTYSYITLILLILFIKFFFLKIVLIDMFIQLFCVIYFCIIVNCKFCV